MARAVLNIPDISCEHCERAITQALLPQHGVEHILVDIPLKRVTVDYDATVTSVEQFKTILDEESYPVQSVS